MFVWDKIKVVFPKSFDFIRDLPSNAVTRFKALGWDTPRTIFLEVPYILVHTETLDPSTCGIRFFPIYEKEIYFRVLTFTKGYIENASDIEIEDSVLHEKKELEQLEKLCEKGPKVDLEKRLSFPFLSEEAIEEASISRQTEYEMHDSEIVEYTLETLTKKYGKERVMAERIKAIRLSYDMRRKLGVIGDGWLTVLSWKYLKQNYNNYMREAMPIFPLLRDIRKTYEMYMEKVDQNCLALPDIVERQALSPI